MRFILTATAALLASTAMAQQAGDGIEVPSAATIQSSTIIPDAQDIPEIPQETQAIEIDDARPVGADIPRTAAESRPEPAGADEATATVEEIVEDTVVDPRTGQVEAATGAARPVESWLVGVPCPEGAAEPCDPTAEVDTKYPKREHDAPIHEGGEATTVRPPQPGNDAVDNLTTGPVADPAANEPAVMSVQTEAGTTPPERPKELENEPQDVLTREGGAIDLEEDARVEPETDTAAELGSGS